MLPLALNLPRTLQTPGPAGFVNEDSEAPRLPWVLGTQQRCYRAPGKLAHFVCTSILQLVKK